MINSVKPNLIVSDSRGAWFRATILFILALIGTVGMWSVVVFIPDIEKEFGLDRGTSSLLYAFTMIGFGFGTVVIGKVYDKFGIKKPILLATFVLMTSYYFYSIFPFYWQFLILQFFMGFAASAFFGPAMADISNFFNKQRGFALSIVASANYVAGATWPLLIGYFLTFIDWRAAHFWISICLFIMIPLILLLKNASVDESKSHDMKQRYKDIRLDLSNNQIQVLLMLAGICCCVAMAMPQVHMVALCVDNGFGLQVGTEILAVMLYSGMISRIVFGMISDRIGPVLTLLLGSFLQMVSLTFFLPFSSEISLYVVSLMFGLSQGGIVPAYAIIIRKYLPIKEAGLRVGLVIGATIVGMSLGGWMSGEIFDITASYYFAFMNGIIWNLFNLIIVIYIIYKSDFWQNRKAISIG